MSDEDKKLYGTQLRQFVSKKIRSQELSAGALHAVNDLLAGKGISATAKNKKVAGNANYALAVIAKVRRLMPNFWREVGHEENAQALGKTAGGRGPEGTRLQARDEETQVTDDRYAQDHPADWQQAEGAGEEEGHGSAGGDR